MAEIPAMENVRKWLFLPPLALLVLLAACTTIQETGKSTVMLVSPQEEQKLGAQSFEELKRTVPVSKDEKNAALIRRVGQKLAPAANLPNAQWEFVLFENSTPNAFALPGGKVGFFTGILPICQDEAGIAVVMSHEIAHVALRHGGERLSQGLMVDMGRNLLAMAVSDNPYKTQQLADMAYGVGSQVFLVLPYSRQQELEADRIGLRYLQRAGYDPRAAVEFWKRFATHNAAQGRASKTGFSEYFSTHPADERRIRQLEQLVASGNY